MMGPSNPQPSMFYQINLEQLVTADHPMRWIRPLSDTARIRPLCEPLSAETGRPSIPPEQLKKQRGRESLFYDRSRGVSKFYPHGDML